MKGVSRPQAHPSYFGVVGCRPLALQAVGFERQHEGMYRLVWKRVVFGSVRTLGLYDQVSRASVWLFARWCEQLQKHTRPRFP